MKRFEVGKSYEIKKVAKDHSESPAGFVSVIAKEKKLIEFIYNDKQYGAVIRIAFNQFEACSIVIDLCEYHIYS